MKITKSIEQVNAEKMTRACANKGCNRCPNCGETGDYFENLINGKSGGIDSLGSRTIYKGFLNIKAYHIDMYICETCGVEWESEPYEV